MGTKPLLVALWLVGTVVAASVAWQSLRLVSASTDELATGPIPSAVTPAVDGGATPSTSGTSSAKASCR